MTEIRGQFTQAQRDTLLKPIQPHRVAKDNKGMSYVEGYEIQAHLNRLFGFEGWDKEILRLDLLLDDSKPDPDKNNRLGWYVTYLCQIRLTVRSVYGHLVKIVEEAGTGSATNQPIHADAHDLALKSAITDALKRCAKDLGDQFGLGLYNKGSLNALVHRVIPYESSEAAISPSNGTEA